MNSILIAIEVLWVAAFALVFVIYFVIRKRVRAQRDREQQIGIKDSPSDQRSRTSPTGNSSADS